MLVDPCFESTQFHTKKHVIAVLGMADMRMVTEWMRMVTEWMRMVMEWLR